jgi:hypothetical protein
MIGDLRGQRADEPRERHRRAEIHRLLHVVRRLVVTLLRPSRIDCRLRRSRFEADLQRERRHSLPDEAVLVGSGKAIPLRLRIGSDGEIAARRYRAYAVAEIGLVESENHH